MIQSKHWTTNLLLIDHQERINELWNDPNDKVVEVSQACCKLNRELDSKSIKQLVAVLPFGMSSFCKFAEIGADPRLTASHRRHLLPVKLSVLYELQQFTDEEFQAFEEEGLLTPRLRHADVTRWVSKRRGEPQKCASIPKLPGMFYAALTPRRQLANTEESKIEAALTALAEQFQMDLVYPKTKIRKGIWEKAQMQIRREGKKIVDEYFRRRRTEVGPYKYQSSPHRRKYVGFVAEEVKIEPDADEERVHDVLTAIGRADQFERIRDAAYDKYEVDTPFESPEWMDVVADKPPPQSARDADIEELRQQIEVAKPKS
ncbi:MAG: hypothetical protein ACJ8EF_20215, partial [Bradyrhizobium sp.]